VDLSIGHGNTDAVTPHNIFENAFLSPNGNINTPSTRPYRPDPVIDPILRDIPDLVSPAQTQTPSLMLQTPDAPGPSMRRNSSSLSDVSGGFTPTKMSEEIPSLKRKRQASKMDGPKAKGVSKARRKIKSEEKGVGVELEDGSIKG
jgi:hypothetical protein